MLILLISLLGISKKSINKLQLTINYLLRGRKVLAPSYLPRLSCSKSILIYDSRIKNWLLTRQIGLFATKLRRWIWNIWTEETKIHFIAAGNFKDPSSNAPLPSIVLYYISHIHKTRRARDTCL